MPNPEAIAAEVASEFTSSVRHALKEMSPEMLERYARVAIECGIIRYVDAVLAEKRKELVG